MVLVAIDASSGQAPIRQAMESLLRAQRRAEKAIADESQAIERRMTRVAEQVHQATKLPRGRTTADEIDALADQTGPVFAAAARDTSAAFAHEVHALLDLLAVNHHDRGPLPPLDTAVIGGPDGLAAAFPEGYARKYITTVMDELEAGGTTSKIEADAHPTRADAAITASRIHVVDQTSRHNQRQVEELMNHPNSHAVELHGPHITAEELELRAGLDPTTEPRHRRRGQVARPRLGRQSQIRTPGQP